MEYAASVKFSDGDWDWMGTVTASNPATAACRAIKEAKKAHPRRSWVVMHIELEKEAKFVPHENS